MVISNGKLTHTNGTDSYTVTITSWTSTRSNSESHSNGYKLRGKIIAITEVFSYVGNVGDIYEDEYPLSNDRKTLGAYSSKR